MEEEEKKSNKNYCVLFYDFNVKSYINNYRKGLLSYTPLMLYAKRYDYAEAKYVSDKLSKQLKRKHYVKLIPNTER
jgi:hypothetical protein